MTHRAIARLLLATLCALQGVGTIAADMNRTHATNPLWTGHARFHVIWQTGTIVLLSGLELFLLYSSLLPQESAFYVVAILAGLPMVSFFFAFFTRPFFGSTLSDPNGIRPVELTLGGKKLCIKMNTVVEFVAFLRAVNEGICDRCQESARPARSFSVRPKIARTSSDGAAGTRISLCAASTNRSLSATHTQLPLDRCGSFHRRMTGCVYWGVIQSSWQELESRGNRQQEIGNRQ